MIANSYNFRKVRNRLTTSGVIGPNRLKGLADEGYAWVINLLPDSDSHAIAEEQQIVEGQGVGYVYIPVDFRKPTLGNYQQFFSALQKAGEDKVHVHCAANFRVSGFYSVYAVTQGLWNQKEADAFVQDLWNPAQFPPWPAFLAAAGEFDGRHF